MKQMCMLVAGLIAFPAYAADLWEVTSTSVGPDGTPMPYTQQQCFPEGGIDPAQILGGIGDCTFDQKNGNASAMTFTLTCKTAGMPAELASMKVAGDASLSGNSFNMNYVITISAAPGATGGDFKMSGKAQARKIGQCDAR
jgi:hypothetical protein